MGNNLMKGYKENYIKNNYTVLKNIKNNIFGEYKIIEINKPEQKKFYLKTIDPNKYNSYQCDINLFIKRLQNENKNINKFIFLTSNIDNNECFDIIFEYNPSIYDIINVKKLNWFKTEKEIWLLVEDMIQAFTIMENKKEHLKDINFHTITLKNSKDFCLMNPYMFENYFEDVLNEYLNKNSQNKSYNKNCINLNLYQFGILILNILNKNFDSYQYDINYKVDLSKIKSNFSKKLYELLLIIFDNENKFIFSDIKSFLINGYKKGDKFDKAISKDQIYPSPPPDKPTNYQNSKNSNIRARNNNSKLLKMKSFEVNSSNKKLEKKHSIDKMVEDINDKYKYYNKEPVIPKINSPNPIFNNIAKKEYYKKNTNKNISISLTNIEGNSKLLFKFLDYTDIKRNEQIYYKLNLVVNLNSDLRESIYHK